MKYYHGTSGKLENGKFEFRESHRSTSNHKRFSNSIFFTPHREIAEGFAWDRVTNKGGIPTLIEAEIEFKNPLDLRVYTEENETIVDSLGINREILPYQDTKNLWELTESEDKVTILKEMGFDGLRINETTAHEYMNKDDPAESIAVFNIDDITILDDVELEL